MKTQLAVAGFANGRAATGVHNDALGPLPGHVGGPKAGGHLRGRQHRPVLRGRAGDSRRARATLGREVDVIVASTHVHEAPDTMGLWGAQTGVSGIDEAARPLTSHLPRNDERRPVLARQHLVRVVVVPGQCRDRIDFQNAVEPRAGERVVRKG